MVVMVVVVVEVVEVIVAIIKNKKDIIIIKTKRRKTRGLLVARRRRLVAEKQNEICLSHFKVRSHHVTLLIFCNQSSFSLASFLFVPTAHVRFFFLNLFFLLY
jgi:hypothetical protein